jgi:hypothetical protein
MGERPREGEKKTRPREGDGEKKTGARDGEASAAGSALYQRLTARFEAFRKNVRDQVIKKPAKDKAAADSQGGDDEKSNEGARDRG